MMSPGPTFTSVVPPPEDEPVSGSITETVDAGMDLLVIMGVTPSPCAGVATNTDKSTVISSAAVGAP